MEKEKEVKLILKDIFEERYLLAKDTQNLKEILEIVKDISEKKLLNDLRKAPGWSYHGPTVKIENKVGPGRYNEPSFFDI